MLKFAFGNRAKMATRLLDHKQQLVSKFNKWTISFFSILKHFQIKAIIVSVSLLKVKIPR